MDKNMDDKSGGESLHGGVKVRLTFLDYERDEIIDCGLFDYVQVTYDAIRVEFDSDMVEIAYFNGEKWWLNGRTYSDFTICGEV